MTHSIIIYTDGSALGNPGPAGFAYLMINQKENTISEYGEHRQHATNNQMELLALQYALIRLCEIAERQDVVIHLDSEYVKNGITSWIKNWKKNGWKTAAKKPVLNKEIWQDMEIFYDKAKLMHDIDLRYVPGHSGFAGNEIVDQIARSMAGKEEYELFSGKREDFIKLRGVKI
jgi:ribonuclease HI